MDSGNKISSGLLFGGSLIIAIFILARIVDEGQIARKVKEEMNATTTPSSLEEKVETFATSTEAASSTLLFDKGLMTPFGEIKIAMATTALDKSKGLGDRESMGEREGMLFTFDKPGRYGIWMKDMKFPIDIVWIDQYKKVTEIDSDVSPLTFPSVYYPNDAVFYVLELNAGQAGKLGIIPGTELIF